MPARTSRRKLARYVAERLMDNDVTVVDEVAALLSHEKRQREVDLLVRDIQAELAERGLTVATVESARALTNEARSAIMTLLKKPQTVVQLSEVVRPELIGGFKLRTPTATLDATIAKKLNDLRAKKI
jgi:hypothetical protein